MIDYVIMLNLYKYFYDDKWIWDNIWNKYVGLINGEVLSIK